MVEPYPLIDRRRANKLAGELDRSSLLFMPELRGVEDEQGAGRALIEIAARLAGEVTQRLDKVPKRDALAFYQELDIAKQAPVSSSTFLVFKLADKRDTPVFASPRIQVAAEPQEGDEDSEELIFETDSSLNIVPAQLAHAIAVDPLSNRIEEPPPQFYQSQPAKQAGPYQVHAFAQSGSHTVQIFPAVGLDVNDVIKIEHQNYRISQVEDGLITLHDEDSLAQDIQTGTQVTKVTRFDLFQGRNTQKHASYIGDANLLNLEQEATIHLGISPATAAGQLANSGAVFELFGINDTNENTEPGWHQLKLTGSQNSQLILSKQWHGQVEKTEVHGQKNRWLRISVEPTQIDDSITSSLINGLTLQVESVEPDKDDLDEPDVVIL